MVFSIFQANKKAKSAEVNDNFAFISGNRLIAVNASTGAPIGTFPIGDLTAITNGSLAGNILGRTGSSLKVYSASGVLIGSVSYDSLLNLRTATTTQEGVGEIATNAETLAGAENGAKFLNPANLVSLFGSGSIGASGNIPLPFFNGTEFVKYILKFGTIPAASIPSFGTNYTIIFPAAFATGCYFVGITPLGAYSSPSVVNDRVVSKAASNFVLAHGQSPAVDMMWFAIGN